MNQVFTSNIIYLILTRFFSSIRGLRLQLLVKASRKNAILFAAIGGLLAIMGYFVYFASLDNPELEKIEIELAKLKSKC